MIEAVKNTTALYSDNVSFEDMMLYFRYIQCNIHEFEIPEDSDVDDGPHHRDLFVVFTVLFTILLSPILLIGIIPYLMSLVIFLMIFYLFHKRFQYIFVYLMIKYMRSRGENKGFAYTEYYKDQLIRYDQERSREISYSDFGKVVSIQGDYFIHLVSDKSFAVLIPKRHIEYFKQNLPQQFELLSKCELAAIETKWPIFS